MKNAQQMAVILYQMTEGSDLKSSVGGQVFKTKLPDAWKGEAVALNVITINDEQFQKGVANVNIYVPDVTENIGGAFEQMPNEDRLDQLSVLAIALFEDVVTSNCRFRISNISGPIAEIEAKRHYVNHRIDFEFFP